MKPSNRNCDVRIGTQRRLLLGPPATENEETVDLQESPQLVKTFHRCQRIRPRDVVGMA